jgi:hypothetical protein
MESAEYLCVFRVPYQLTMLFVFATSYLRPVEIVELEVLLMLLLLENIVRRLRLVLCTASRQAIERIER